MPHLFTPITLRDVTLKNRVVIAPMCQYSARDGIAQPWHMVQYGRFAVGGAGMVMVEASAVSPEGRITHGDVGIWSDAHAEALAPIAAFVKSQGAVPAIQLAHAGRKASMQRPWFGNGPLGPEDTARGDEAWPIVAPSAIPYDEGWLTPAALDEAGLTRLADAWAQAATRALGAGFEAVEIHMAHGYLLHSFLSPLSNRRNDAWGGDLEGRMRFPLRVAEAVRAVLPEGTPLFVRISSVDGVEDGWSLDDSVAFATRLNGLGVDVVDCSSGGNTPAFGATSARVKRDYGFQVPFAERVKAEAGLSTMAVGLIVAPAQAEAIVAEGRADLVAIGREALENPNWPLHALAALEAAPVHAEAWPVQHGWWLDVRDVALARLGPWRG